ncbi:hypothetical protein [Neobacillus niacini]
MKTGGALLGDRNRINADQ